MATKEFTGIDVIRRENTKRLMDEANLTRQEFANQSGIAYGLLGHYIGKNPTKRIGDEIASKIEDFFEKPRHWLDHEHDLNQKRPLDGQSLESMNIRRVVDMDEGELEDDEFEVTKYMEVYVVGGNSELPVVETVTEKIRMKKAIARRAGASMTQSFCYNLSGDSMHPKIMDGAECTGDASKKEIKDGKIYCFRHGVIRRTKYLFRTPNGGLLVRSENREDYPDEYIKPEDMEDVEIIGWIYHWCNTEAW